MSFVIYHEKSFKRFKAESGQESFPSERVAKGVLTKAVNRGAVMRADWIVASYDAWVAADPIVETYNLLDPERKPIPIRKSEKGGSSDPSQERYHTM